MRKLTLVVLAASMTGCLASPVKRPKPKVVVESPENVTVLPKHGAGCLRRHKEVVVPVDEDVRLEVTPDVRWDVTD